MKQIRIAAALAVALVAGRAEAQVFTPTFMSPVPGNDFGVYVSGIGEVGIEGIWRRMSRGGSDVGIRVGYADVGDGALLAGIEVRNPVVLAGAPIGLAFTAGAQGIVGDATQLGGQVGFSVGQALPAGTFTITPYIHPRLAVLVDPDADEAAGEDEIDVDVLADIGADFAFAGGVTLRLGINLADGADWGLGLAWRN
ncbi:MAG TPA: hypothetical protein VFR37_07975 [Longimicrobium sp.]|nr:hypothetical protein [Longimicrobium sp.]